MMEMEVMHPLCRKLMECLPVEDQMQCSFNSDEMYCFDGQVTAYVNFKEIKHRAELAKEISTMFPQYSHDLIQQTIQSVPLHINAQFAILRAIAFGCHCPAYNLPPFTTTNDILNETIEENDGIDFDDIPYYDIPELAGAVEVFEMSEVPSTEMHALNQPCDVSLLEDKNTKVNEVKDVNYSEAGPSGYCNNNNVCTATNLPQTSTADIYLKPSTSKHYNQSVQQIDLDEADDNDQSVASDDSWWADSMDNSTWIENLSLIHSAPSPIIRVPMKRASCPVQSSCPPAKKRLSAGQSTSSTSSKPQLQHQPIIIIDKADPASVQKLINILSEIFPDCEMNFMANLCKGKEYSTANVDNISEQLLTQDYPKKTKEEPIDFDEQLDIMMSVLPDADPEYLSTELGKMQGNDELKVFISQALEFHNYPKLADVTRKKQMCAQVRQYTTDFNPEQFLKTIPNPETYFNRKTFRAGIIDRASMDMHYVHYFLRNHFCKISLKKITAVFAQCSTFLEVVEKLEHCMRTCDGVISSKRKRLAIGSCNNIPLLQLFAYIEHKTLISRTKEQLKIEAERRKQEAIANKEVNTCGCCFDDEVMMEDTISCPNNCIVCKECIKRSTEILFAENNLTFPCLSSCGAHYSLETLQACVTPKIFCKLAKRKQLEEVRAAGIDDLEICPFCDFAAIPPAGDKVFKCFNPECMKETCRLCKEPSHIPLHCDEVEKDNDVKQRVFVENQMTEALMRKCWKCALKFIKSDGCNKITCQCGATMCYVCNTSNVDYKHFNGLGGKEFKKCPLYSNTDLLHEQNAINGGLQAKKQLGVESMKVDPLADADVRLDKATKAYQKRPGEL